MKLLVIGCGQCGGRVADEFARRNRMARAQRGIEIVTDAIAVNTDIADLSGLVFIKSNYRHRIMIGSQKSGGHGVGKINELGAEIARDDGDKVLESVAQAQQASEADAFLLIAGAAGGTGSGAIAVLSQQIREHYPGKPLYNLIILPFRYEEATEDRAIFNVGTCLKSAYLVADAVILADNQRYLKERESIKNNLARINSRLVAPFYNLLCAGEETDPRFVGSRVVDAGDIIQTLAGWTVIGQGRTQVSRKFPFSDKFDFRDRASETDRGMQAMNQAMASLSLKCTLSDARRALYLLTSPPERMSIDLIKDLSASLRSIATDAIIRSGDYPRGRAFIDVAVVLSELTNSRRISDYFSRTLRYIYLSKQKRGDQDLGKAGIEEALRDIPLLI
ncbi:MAG: tubulin/FtsZ family protein [Dehalococcoidales bacterium]